jgi:hypothetical protein
MLLRLCADCDRHVRAEDEVCPFCRGTTSRPLPASVVSGSRTVRFLGLGALAMVVDTGCSATIIGIYGAPASDQPVPSPKPSADGGTKAPEWLSGCAIPRAAEHPREKYPSASCADAEIDELLADCVGPRATEPSCTAARAMAERCGSCLFGVEGGSPWVEGYGAVVALPDGRRFPNIDSCAAFTIGMPECAAELGGVATCAASVCATCSIAKREACETEARTRLCDASDTCKAAVERRRAEWEPRCAGPDAYVKVARARCAAPLPDAGTDAASSEGGSDARAADAGPD